MLNHRFMPYIVGVCVAGLLIVCYSGYRQYQKHIEFESFITGTQTLNDFVEHTDVSTPGYLTDPQLHTDADWGSRVPGGTTDTANPYFVGKRDDEYVYKVGDGHIYTPEPFDREFIEMQAWEITGVKTPYVEKRLNELAENSPYKGQVVQRIVTPDGQLHNVIVPRDMQYEEGDAILHSELNPPILEAFNHQPSGEVDIGGEPIPDEYYAIDDPYEQHKFIKKVMLSKRFGVSIAKIDAKIAAGELDLSLSAGERENVDQKLAIEQRKQMLLSFARPASSDKSPVKVSFLSDTAEDAMPGWMQKMQGNRPQGSDEAASDGDYSATDPFSEGSINEDASGAPVRSDVPASPSDLPDIVKPIFPQSVADIEKQLTPQGIEAELSEGLSPERFSKAQKLIDQYGTAEGLRRLREVDPEAARQFERHPPNRPASRTPSSRDTPNGEESER